MNSLPNNESVENSTVIYTQETCPYCQEEFTPTAKCAVLACGHFSHLNCGLSWFNHNPTCMVCRAALIHPEIDLAPPSAMTKAWVTAQSLLTPTDPAEALMSIAYGGAGGGFLAPIVARKLGEPFQHGGEQTIVTCLVVVTAIAVAYIAITIFVKMSIFGVDYVTNFDSFAGRYLVIDYKTLKASIDARENNIRAAVTKK